MIGTGLDRRAVRRRAAAPHPPAGPRGRLARRRPSGGLRRRRTACRAPTAPTRQLVADPDIDVVYIATPHTAHHPCARLALEAGKHTLVEKPLGINASEAAEIAALADGRGLFCMEALWTFFLPKFDVVRQLLEDGALGEIRTVLADHGEDFTAEHRILRADLAGGPLLDLGTYPVSFATWVLGEPERVLADGPAAPGRRQRPGRGDPDRRPRQPGRPAHDAVLEDPDVRDHRRHGGDPHAPGALLHAGRHELTTADGAAAPLQRAARRA